MESGMTNFLLLNAFLLIFRRPGGLLEEITTLKLK